MKRWWNENESFMSNAFYRCNTPEKFGALGECFQILVCSGNTNSQGFPALSSRTPHSLHDSEDYRCCCLLLSGDLVGNFIIRASNARVKSIMMGAGFVHYFSHFHSVLYPPPVSNAFRSRSEWDCHQTSFLARTSRKMATGTCTVTVPGKSMNVPLSMVTGYSTTEQKVWVESVPEVSGLWGSSPSSSPSRL